MTRSYRCQLLPTRSQSRVLAEWLVLCRELYNAALQERRDAWTKQRVHVSLYDQQKALPSVREVRPEFDTVPIVVLRGVLRRLDRAFAAFFRRCKSGEKPGYPRFKGRGQFESLLFDDLSRGHFLVAAGKRLAVPLLGKIKLRLHRPLESALKTMRLTVDAAGHWFVTLSCVDVPAKPLPKTGRQVGIDLGLSTFVATSDGTLFENPRTLRGARLDLERAQRRVSRRKRGSHRRDRARRLLARKHAHIANVRRENHILVALALVSLYDTVYVEDLNVKGLAASKLAKPVHDVAWGNFLHWLRVKAESAGRDVVEVDPRGTSQFCSACGVEVRKDLSVRVHRCLDCGYTADRDVNAARNVLGAGLALRGVAPLVEGRPRSAKLKSSRRPGHTIVAKGIV